MGNGILATDYANVTDNNYERGADLTGNADGSKGICSFWFFPVVPSASIQSIYSAAPGASNIVSFFPSLGNRIRITFVQPSAASAFFMFNMAGTLTVGSWHHILASWDLTIPSPPNPRLQFLVNGVNDISIQGSTASAVIDYTQPAFGWV